MTRKKDLEINSKYFTLPKLEEMLLAGIHFGHQKRRWHPRIAPYLYETGGKIHIFDLIKTKDMLEKACQFLFDTARGGGSIIFVGTKRQASEMVKNYALHGGAYFVNKRWLGGTITNYDSIKKKLQRLEKIEEGLKSGGEFESFTKKERLDLSRELSKLNSEIGGLRGLKSPPQTIFVIDIKRELTAVREARKKRIPVVAVVDSNCSPDLVDFPIPANDDSARSIEIILKTLSDAVRAGVEEQKKAGSEPVPEAGKAEESRETKENIPHEKVKKKRGRPKKTKYD